MKRKSKRKFSGFFGDRSDKSDKNPSTPSTPRDIRSNSVSAESSPLKYAVSPSPPRAGITLPSSPVVIDNNNNNSYDDSVDDAEMSVYEDNVKRLALLAHKRKTRVFGKDIKKMLHGALSDDSSSSPDVTTADIETIIEEDIPETEEIKFFRDHLNEQAREASHDFRPTGLEIDTSKQALANVKEISITPELCPIYLSEGSHPDSSLPEYFIADIHFPGSIMSKVGLLSNETADESIQRIVEFANQKHSLIKFRAEDFILKATGVEEYLYGGHKLKNFVMIRECIESDTIPVLTLFQKSKLLARDADIFRTLSQKSPSGYGFFDYYSQSPRAESSPLVKDLKIDTNDHMSAINKELRFYKLYMAEMQANALSPKNCILSSELRKPLSFKILYAQAEMKAMKCNAYISAGIYYGGRLLSEEYTSKVSTFSNGFTAWNHELIMRKVAICNLPREAKLCLKIISCDDNNSEKILGWGFVRIFDYNMQMITGGKVIPLQTCEFNSVGICGSFKPLAPSPTMDLAIKFDSFTYPVHFPKNNTDPIKTESLIPKQQLQNILNRDYLRDMTDLERCLVWSYREYLKTNPDALTAFLDSVDWSNPPAIQEAYRLLHIWAPIVPSRALELLHPRFSDWRIREYAVAVISQMPDNGLCSFMLQLVEALKAEENHYSALSALLLERAVKAPHSVGNSFFWNLKSQMHDTRCKERFSILVEAYLKSCGSYVKELLKQTIVCNKLLDVAILMKNITEGDKNQILATHLNDMQFRKGFKLFLNPKVEISALEPEKCKVMSSKKKPLFLTLKNEDSTAAPVQVIFKAGDDLRQDQLTLQMLSIMDIIWKNNGLDLHMICYGCVPLGEAVGMIEVVQKAKTIADITVSDSKGISSAFLNFKTDRIEKFLKKHNESDESMKLAIDKFIKSCAGYCVATHVIGIGDRHNDNVMLTNDGNLFHIDFGHFLGHFKKKLNYERETTPFVFTHMYAHVLGGVESENFKTFENLCCKAFNLLRANSRLLITLLSLMLTAQLPELQGIKDIEYMRDKLKLEATDPEAAEHFKKLIKESLANQRQKLNDTLHIANNMIKKK